MSRKGQQGWREQTRVTFLAHVAAGKITVLSPHANRHHYWHVITNYRYAIDYKTLIVCKCWIKNVPRALFGTPNKNATNPFLREVWSPYSLDSSSHEISEFAFLENNFSLALLKKYYSKWIYSCRYTCSDSKTLVNMLLTCCQLSPLPYNILLEIKLENYKIITIRLFLGNFAPPKFLLPGKVLPHPLPPKTAPGTALLFLD